MDLESIHLTISLSPLCRHIPRAMDSEKGSAVKSGLILDIPRVGFTSLLKIACIWSGP